MLHVDRAFNDWHKGQGSARNSSSWLHRYPDFSQRIPGTSVLILPRPGSSVSPLPLENLKIDMMPERVFLKV
jgi:hypothetical protein